MTTYLVPFDGSDCAHAALELAADWASREGGRLIMLHVQPYVAVRPEASTGSTNFEMMRHDEAELEKIKRGLLAKRKAFTVEIRVEVGEAESLILDEAEREGADHVVMGTHGRTGVARLFLGSIAERVVQRCTVPVTVVKSPKAAATVKSLVAAEAGLAPAGA